MPKLLTCGVCGIGFHGRSDAVYCSSACRQKAHRARNGRRIATLASPRGPRTVSRRVLIKPDVAATIQRAQHEQRRARELCRTAADTLRETVASHRRLTAARWLTRAKIAAPMAPWSGQAAASVISRRSG